MKTIILKTEFPPVACPHVGRVTTRENRKYRKKHKTEKQTHFAVTSWKGTDYREYIMRKQILGTNSCSKIVEALFVIAGFDSR